MYSYKYDCRLFSGYRPCAYDCECEGCEHYVPKGARVLVLRVTQLGNIVKSTPILHALRRRYDDPWITWVCSSVAAPMLRANPLVDEVVEWSWENALALQARSFDLILTLEANAAEAALGQSIPATERLGFGVHESGSLMPVDEQSTDYVSLSFSDRLRFRENQKTLAELCFDLVGVPYQGEEYILEPSESDLSYARSVLTDLGIDPDSDRVIALATGGDTRRFPTKDWPVAHFVELARILSRETDAKILLVGGPMERELNARLASDLSDAVIDSGCNHTMMQFAALLSQCDVVVGADSFPLHVAVAMKTYVVGLFGPTPPQEVAIFGRGRKLVTDLDCAPCYLRQPQDCPRGVTCMRGITPDMAADATLRALADAREGGA